MTPDEKMVRLRAILAEMESVLVAFSGGVDSALVLAVAQEVLGDRAVALTADSVTLAPEEAENARAVAARLGARHEVVSTHELEREGYAQNGGNRCYFCKTELFELASSRAAMRGLRWVADGTIVDDLSGHRPGLAAAAEHGVRHPLVEAGFCKADVREAARALGLPVWDKPSFACLGSRFAVGTRVTSERVTRVARVETALRRLGFRQFRVRIHAIDAAELARIEVGIDEVAAVTQPETRAAIIAACKAEGYSWITLDLEGYRTGSTALRSGPSGAEIARPAADSS